MIKTQSDDPNVEKAAEQALGIVKEVLSKLPKAETFDYGGHNLHLGEYEVCSVCTGPIAEAQQANQALLEKADSIDDPVVKEHVVLAAQLFKLEGDAAVVRAQLHNGISTEQILNALLAFQYERSIHDDYHHSHQQGG
jgi:hypothetical protein